MAVDGKPTAIDGTNSGASLMAGAGSPSVCERSSQQLEVQQIPDFVTTGDIVGVLEPLMLAVSLAVALLVTVEVGVGEPVNESVSVTEGV